MALITCPECGKQISDKAAACINCGCPVSAMKTEPSKKEAAPFGDIFKDIFGSQASVRPTQTAPAKPVPTEIPEMRILPGIILQILSKACGVCGLAGFTALASLVVNFLSDSKFEKDFLLIAVLGLGAGYLMALGMQAMEFMHTKNFLQKNGYEDSIRYDSPAMTNSVNAFTLCRNRMMVRYIKRLNPAAGEALLKSVNQIRDNKRKERLGYLPYLAVLFAVYCLLPRFCWNIFHSDAACLIATHLITLAVMGVYSYKKGMSLGIILITALLFAPSIFAYYFSEMWYHILICAAAAFVGMLIGQKIKSKK